MTGGSWLTRRLGFDIGQSAPRARVGAVTIKGRPSGLPFIMPRRDLLHVEFSPRVEVIEVEDRIEHERI